MRHTSLLTIALLLLIATGFALSNGQSAESAFPGQAGKIAFTGKFTGDQDVWTMDPDGGNLTNLTSDPAYYDGTAVWSPDGTRIAYFHINLTDPSATGDLYLMNADGGNKTRLTLDNSGDEENPSWSPDGATIAYEDFRDFQFQLHSIGANGADETNLSSNSFNDEFPAWSPDGQTIAFMSDRDGHEEIYLMDTDGTDQRRITFSNSNQVTPAWSPDGSMIAYASDAPGNLEIYVANANGSNATRLTFNDYDDFMPSWSPDGSLIMYDAYASDVVQLATIHPDGSAETFFSLGASAFDSDWQRIVAGPSAQGNVDCANGIGMTDVLLVVRATEQLAALPCPENADVNCDLGTDLHDALDIIRFLASLPLSVTPGTGCRTIGVS